MDQNASYENTDFGATMLKILNKSKYKTIKDKNIFSSLEKPVNLRIHAILDQTFAGDIWIDNEQHPTVAYIFDSRNGHVLVGDIDSNKGDIIKFVQAIVYPVISQSRTGSVLISRSVWDIINYEKSFDFITNATIINRQLYKCTSKNPRLHQIKLPEGFEIREVTKELLTLNLKNSSGLIEELQHMWGNSDNFFTLGMGVCAVTNDSIAGWCLGEYFSSTKDEKQFGIGIETVDMFQKKGLATAMTLKLVEMGLKRGYTIYWDCMKANIPSVRTAVKTGFELVSEYQILYVPSL